MMTANGMILTEMQALVPTFMIPVIPGQKISLSLILEPDQKALRATYADDVAFTKGATHNELFFDILGIDTCKFVNYDGFYISPTVVLFDPN